MRRHIAVPLALLVVACAAGLQSFPRFSAEHGEPCRNCHFSPSGAGARTEYGNSTTAFNELTLPQTKKLLKDKYRKSRIGDILIVGGDLRYLMVKGGTVVRMQTDGFLTLEPFRGLLYHVRVGNTGVKESYGMLSLADDKYSLRVGTFEPAFGLHNEDHTTFNRTMTGNGQEVYLDGASLAADLLGGQAIVEAFNPSGKYMFNFHGFHALSMGKIGALVGASYRLTEDSSFFPTAAGVFGGLNLDRFTALGEADLIGKGNDSVALYGNLTTRIEYGVYLVGEYSFFDPDRHVQSGTQEFWRISLDFYPVPFVQLRPSYTYFSKDSGPSRDEWFLQFHIGY